LFIKNPCNGVAKTDHPVSVKMPEGEGDPYRISCRICYHTDQCIWKEKTWSLRKPATGDWTGPFPGPLSATQRPVCHAPPATPCKSSGRDAV